MSNADRLRQEAISLHARAKAENRELTGEERGRFFDLINQAEDADAGTKMAAVGKALGPPTPSVGQNGRGGQGPGDVFVRSEGYKAVRYPDGRPQQWSSGMVEVTTGAPGYELKGTLLESTAGGPGGGLVPPFYQPGINSRLFEPLGVSDVFGTSQTTASQVRYVNEGTATSGAAGVAEAGTKPESTLNYAEIQEPVKKIATVLGISDEMLEDAPSIQAYLNGRLSLFVRIEEERQLLRGTGTNELIGLFNRSGAQAINTYTKLAADDNTVALAKVIANTAGSAFLQPDTVVLHPANWLSSRLLRDGTGGTIGQYFGGGPFSSAYGGGAANVGMFGQTLWNTNVVLSTVVGSGTALVGNFGQGAHIWRRGGVSVEATNSHSDWFIKDLTAIRAESRLALGLYRPASFTAVSGLT